MASNVRKTGKQAPKEVRKPFVTGDPIDENTVKSALAFFGIMIIVVFISFIACASTSSGSLILRLIINPAIIILTLTLFFNNGSGKGAEAVTRGEILYQRKEKGQSFSDSERKVCYHKLKGFAIGIIGTLLFLIPAVILAFNTSLQTTDSGSLPSWMAAYTRRSDIGDALVHYTQPEMMDATGIIRTFVRICLLPYVNLIGYSDYHGILLLERISPILFLLPAVSYGIGYLTGKKIRTGIHTAISENNKRRIRKEKKRIRMRNGNGPKREPEQLN